MACVVTRYRAIYISTLSQLPSVRKKRWPTGPDMKCGKRAKKETSVVQDTTLLTTCHGEESDMVCPVKSLSHETNALNEEASNGIYAAEGQETRTCTDSCGATNAHVLTKSSKLN